MSTCKLYRHFNNDGRLLYVGISVNPLSRLEEHKNSKWFASIAKMTVETFATTEEAERAEKLAIKSESPICNILHNDSGDLLPRTYPHVTFRLPQPLKDQLEACAKTTRGGRSQVIRDALEKHLWS